jgi:NAD(P)-dependent dehydrogenase (short-subunit alcohol dehydrogenase family)
MENSINTVLVSGAANGIGAASFEKFIQQGCQFIIALDRDEEALNALVKRYANHDLTIVPILADVTEVECIESLSNALEPVAQLDAVVLSHGIADENDISEGDIFDKVLNVNLLSTRKLLACCEEKLAKGSAVVMISSILGKMGNRRNTAYCSSKHAQLGLMKGLAMDWARRGVRVNAVLPCYVDTPMLRSELQKQADLTGSTLEKVMKQAKKRIPLREYVSSADIADSVYFLSSPHSRMITAQSIIVDGGTTCGG